MTHTHTPASRSEHSKSGYEGLTAGNEGKKIQPVSVLIMNKVSDQTVEADHSDVIITFQDIIYIFYLLTLYYLSPVNLMCNSYLSCRELWLSNDRICYLD